MTPALSISLPRLGAVSALFLLALGLCLAAQPSVSPIFKAVEADDKEGLRALLPTQAPRVNQPYLGRTPLHLAALNNHLQQARDLIAAGADVNAQDARGDTPLHLAALARRLVMTRGLLALGADARAVNRRGATALHIAAWTGASPQLWQALARAGADANARDAQGRAPLEIARRLYPSLAAEVLALPELAAPRD